MKTNSVNSSTPVYAMKVAVQLSNTSRYSIRKYIDKGLIIPHKTETGRHLFSQIDITRLQKIRDDLDENGLNVAGIKRIMAQTPCWLIKPCSEEEYLNCEAYNSPKEPCWMVGVKGPKCGETECRLCNVYQIVERCDDIKELFKNIDYNYSAD